MSTVVIGRGGGLKRAMDFGKESVLKRLEVGTNRKDLFFYLVSKYIICQKCSLHRLRPVQCGEDLPETERPSFHDLAQNGTLAIIAGSDTTSSVLTAIIYYLLLNPVAYERLQEEVDGAFLSGEEPLDAVKLSQLEWLNGSMWVITHVKCCQRLIFSLRRQQRRSPSSASRSKRVAALGRQGQGSQSTREAVSRLCRPCGRRIKI